jgi:hypothetical protein
MQQQSFDMARDSKMDKVAVDELLIDVKRQSVVIAFYNRASDG